MRQITSIALLAFVLLSTTAKGQFHKSKSVESPSWQVDKSRNKMDGTSEVFLGILDKSGKQASLIIRCIDASTQVFITNLLSTIDNENIRIRFDDSLAFRQFWCVSKNRQSLFAPDAISFCLELAKAKSLFIEFSPYGERPQVVEFSAIGFSSKLKAISTACSDEWDNWEPLKIKLKQFEEEGRKIREEFERKNGVQ